MNAATLTPVLLLLLPSLALSIIAAMVALVVLQARRRRRLEPQSPALEPTGSMLTSTLCTAFFRRPACWLAVKSQSLPTVQHALGLHHTKSCSFLEGLSGAERLFVSPQVQGWILVMGASLPNPSDDVDACFRFVLDLSRKLGEVQYFIADPILHEHAWVRADGGRVARAYAWAGKTLWTQGRRTEAERELNLKCFGYAESFASPSLSESDVIANNVERVPLLAARWSLDPGRIDEQFLEHERGIAGELSVKY